MRTVILAPAVCRSHAFTRSAQDASRRHSRRVMAAHSAGGRCNLSRSRSLRRSCACHHWLSCRPCSRSQRNGVCAATGMTQSCLLARCRRSAQSSMHSSKRTPRQAALPRVATLTPIHPIPLAGWACSGCCLLR